MRVLVTGVKGQLGYECVRTLKDRGYKDVIGIDKDELDITKREDVFKYIKATKPDVIMHNAAYTAADNAEHDGKMAYLVNEYGTENLALAAEMVGAKFLYISSDYVFSGKGSHYHEIDEIAEPLNVYGVTKLGGENAAKKCSKYFVVRISWVFGINGNNFVKTMIRLGKQQKEVFVVDDQIGSPTYTYDLAILLCDMIETEKYGVYHATNEGLCSWADFAEAIFKETGMDVLVHHITTSEYFKIKAVQAKRPLNSRLSKKCLDDNGFKRLPIWQDALKRYVEELRKAKQL